MFLFACFLYLIKSTAAYGRCSQYIPVSVENVDTVTSQLHFDIHHPLKEKSVSVPSYGLNVLDYGAKGDSVTDNTIPFNTALQAAASKNNGGGGFLYVPSGQYIFSGSITIPTGVTLIGTYMFAPRHYDHNETKGVQWNDLEDGSILASHKNYDTSFIIMQSSSTIKGFSIFYPDQKCNNKPIVYPATILMTGQQIAIMDLELINSYIGIYPEPNKDTARHYIARIEGGPILIGIYIDDCHDIGRVENIHFKGDWSCGHNTTITSFAAKYGRGFVIGDTDWEYFFNTFCFGYAGGYNFISTGPPGSRNVAPNGNYLGIAADACSNYSVRVDQSKAWGISITNGEFVARANPDDPEVNTATNVIISKENIGSVHFTNCAFWGSKTSTQHIAEIHSDSSTSFENCQFYEWNSKNPAIYADNGTVRLTSNNFAQANALIEFKSGTKKAIVVGNSFEGTPTINVDNGVAYANSANL
eukprot:303927_1